MTPVTWNLFAVMTVGVEVILSPQQPYCVSAHLCLPCVCASEHSGVAHRFVGVYLILCRWMGEKQRLRKF